MTKAEIHKELANYYNNFYRYALKIRMDHNEASEVVQELYLYYQTMQQDTLQRIYDKDGIKGLVGYGCIVIKRSLISKKSQYYYKMNKYYEKISSLDSGFRDAGDRDRIKEYIEQEPEVEEVQSNKQYIKLEFIDECLDKMYWYDAKVFRLYYYEAGNTLDSLASKTKISRNSLFTTIDKVRETLKLKALKIDEE
tara:strand:+ start:13345 stop:13929 length:585 start_codon:yes stop_codon:yes gene_type:complete